MMIPSFAKGIAVASCTMEVKWVGQSTEVGQTSITFYLVPLPPCTLFDNTNSSRL